MELLPPPPPFPSLEDDSKEDFNEILPKPEKEFKPIELENAEEEISQAVEKIQKKPSFLKKLLTPQKKPSKIKHPEVEIKPEMDGTKAVQNLVKSSRDSLLEFDLDKAREFYIEANKIYNELQVDEKAEVYNEVKSLYDERKSAEALKLV